MSSAQLAIPFPLTESAGSLLAKLEAAIRSCAEVRVYETADGGVLLEVMAQDYTTRAVGRGATLEEAIARALEEEGT